MKTNKEKPQTVIKHSFCALALLTSITSYGQEQSSVEHGKEVYQHWCSPCHAPGPRHPGTQALEVLYRGSLPAVLEQRTDLTTANISRVVREGVSIMAPFRKTEISDGDLSDLALYLTTAAE